MTAKHFSPTEAQLDEMERRYRGGEALADIGRTYNRGPDVIARYMARRGLNRATLIKERDAKIDALLKSDLSTAEIARRLDMPIRTVQSRLTAMGHGTAAESLDKERQHLFDELEFLCGTDSFDGLCRRLGTTIAAVERLCDRWGRTDLRNRLRKTRIYYDEDQNAA